MTIATASLMFSMLVLMNHYLRSTDIRVGAVLLLNTVALLQLL